MSFASIPFGLNKLLNQSLSSFWPALTKFDKVLSSPLVPNLSRVAHLGISYSMIFPFGKQRNPNPWRVAADWSFVDS